MARTTSTGRGRSASSGGGSSVDRLGDSIDAARAALKDLRGELSRGSRDLVKDLDVLLRDAGKHLRGTRRTLMKDLEEVQKAAAGKPSAAQKRAPAKRTAAKRTATKSAPAKRTAAKSGTAKRGTAAKGRGAASARKPAGQAARGARRA